MPRRAAWPAAVTVAVLGPAGGAWAAMVPATVGAARTGDPAPLAAAGVDLATQPAPRLVPAPGLAGVAPAGGLPERALRMAPDGRLTLFGRGGWVFRGATVATLAPVAHRPDLDPGSGPGAAFTADEGMVVWRPGPGGGRLTGYAPDLTVRWATGPTTPGAAATPPDGPFALGPGDTLWAVGGTPSVMRAGDGATTATLQNAPAGMSTPVVAPDGTLRVLSGAGTGGPVMLHAYAPDGRRLWSTSVVQGTSPRVGRASAPSVGPDGTTYVSTWVGAGAATTDGRVVAVGPQGLVRWSEAVGRASSQPALDAGGRVWTVARDGVVQAADDRGLPVFRRRLAAGGPADWVAATGDGVTVHAGAMTVGLAARPQAGRRPAARLLVRPVVIRVGARHLRCVAPPGGGPATCLDGARSAGRALVRAPVDGVARLRVESATGGTARRWERVRVLAGDNRILLHLGAGLRPGRYLLVARVPLGHGRMRTLTRAFRVGR